MSTVAGDGTLSSPTQVADASAFNGVLHLAVSPDGANLYATYQVGVIDSSASTRMGH
jgi:hypothetical protein